MDIRNSYIYGPGGLPIEQISSGGTVLYLHHDQQGSTRLITGSSGTVEGKCTYTAYGTPTCEGSAKTPLGYDAQYTSTDTGLIYMRARTYDPATAQFLTQDQLEAITREPYSYASDDPLNYSAQRGSFSAYPARRPPAKSWARSANTSDRSSQSRLAGCASSRRLAYALARS